MKDKRYALLVGINYYTTDVSLSNSIKNVKLIQELLKNNFKYKDNNIIVLTDDTILPTKENILKNLRNFAIKAVKNEIESIFFYYSGHGTYLTDYKQNTSKKKNKIVSEEILCPIDYNDKGYITQTLLNSIIKLFPKNIIFFSLLDCYNQGSIFNLKYSKLNTKELIIDESSNLVCTFISISGHFDSNNNILNDIIYKSKLNGIITKAFIKSLSDNNYDITYFTILKSIKKYMKKNKYNYSIQLNSSIELDKHDYYCKNNKKTLFIEL